MRELLILRHGKSDWESGLPDIDRPLKKRGRNDAKQIGLWLKEQKLIPDLVVTSPAERAISTTLICCQKLGLNPKNIAEDEQLYMAGVDELLGVLRNLPDDLQRVMVVGHNPGLDELVEYLSSTQPPRSEDGKLMPTATLARFKIPEGVSLDKGAGELLSITRPRDLPQ